MGDGGRIPLEAWFWEMPVCTRWWTTATVLTSALVQCQMVTPFQLFYSVRTVFTKGEVRISCDSLDQFEVLRTRMLQLPRIITDTCMICNSTGGY
jgi:hypothetical protein